MIWAWSYESSAVGDGQTHLLDIMRVAEARNAAAEVTAILAFDSAGYFQILEGSFLAVSHLRRSILRDRRHRVNWERLEPVAARRTPATLPAVFLPCEIPHGAILQPRNARALAEFENRLQALAAETFPITYAGMVQRQTATAHAPRA